MQLELAPELEKLNPQFESADATGPSFCLPMLRDVLVSRQNISGGTIDRRLLIRGIGGMTLTVYVYRAEAPDGLERELDAEHVFRDLRSAIEATRRTSALPVNEVSEMMGLSRRGLYKIINEGRTAAATEAHIFRIADVVSGLLDALGEPHLVRAALLTPLRTFDNRSFIEVAGTRDTDDLHAAVELLLGPEGRAAIERQWHRTQPLSDEGATVTQFIEESVDRPV